MEIVLRIGLTGKIDSVDVMKVTDTTLVSRIRKYILFGPQWVPAFSGGQPVESAVRYKPGSDKQNSGK